MPRETPTVGQGVVQAFEAELRELESTRDRQYLAVVTRVATGTGDINHTFGLDRKFRLVFARCHFTGAAGTAAFRLSLDSESGSAYDALLFTITLAGVGKDVNLRIAGSDAEDPSPWTFQAADLLRVQWTNPDTGNITWGLEVGLVLAS